MFALGPKFGKLIFQPRTFFQEISGKSTNVWEPRHVIYATHRHKLQFDTTIQKIQKAILGNCLLSASPVATTYPCVLQLYGIHT